MPTELSISIFPTSVQTIPSSIEASTSASDFFPPLAEALFKPTAAAAKRALVRTFLAHAYLSLPPILPSQLFDETTH